MNLYFNGEHNPFQYDPSLELYVRTDRLNPIVPSYGSPLTNVPLVDVIRFGKGYAQIQPSSTRTNSRTMTLKFSERPKVVITALRRFFDGEESGIYIRDPSEYFFYAPPEPYGNPDGLPIKWVAVEGYTIDPVQYNAWTFSVKIEESFQP